MPRLISYEQFADKKASICIIGLGYVGLPLAVASASKFDVNGFDINPNRVRELEEGFDRTEELNAQQLR